MLISRNEFDCFLKTLIIELNDYPEIWRIRVEVTSVKANFSEVKTLIQI